MVIKTKIVATIGPASNSYERLKDLGAAGVTIFRLNFSHGEYDWHKDVIEKIKKLRQETGNQYAIMLDTKGPEVRTGPLNAPLQIQPTDQITLTINPSEYEKTGKISVSYPEFINDVSVGDQLLIDSGVITFIVQKITETDIICTSMDEGVLTSRRHINVPGAHISLPAVTEKDWEDLTFGLENDIDFIAMSFVREAKEINTVKEFLINNKSQAQIIAKIETGEAVTNLDSIIAVSDGLMVARGDLGAEIPLAHVPIIQHQIITKAQEALKPVIVATQMLESMTENPIPTRAEVTDVFHAVSDQTDAIMLSGETASGEYPVKTVLMMASIAAEAEEIITHTVRTLKAETCTDMQYEIAKMAVQMSEDMPSMAGIIAITKTGDTAKKVSHFRPDIPVFAYTNRKQTCSFMQLLWGITAICGEFDEMVPERTIHKALTAIRTKYPELKTKKIIIISDSLVGDETNNRVPMLQIRTI